MLRQSAPSLFIALLAVLPCVAQADILFGDVGYDVSGADDGREWVALQNTGPNPVDLTGWKFFEGGVNHRLVPFTNALIPAGGSAVIVTSSDGYLADHPGYSGLMFTSSFSLSNSGETLSLKNASGMVMTSVTYAPKPEPAPRPPVAKKIVSNPSVSLPVHSEDGGGIIPWIGGVLAVIVAGIGAAFMMRPVPNREADGYRITDHKS